MNTVELRDRLLEQRTLYQKSLENSQVALQKIKNVLDGITETQIEQLLAVGIDARGVLTMDLERMTTDGDYLQVCSEQLAVVIEKIHVYLEEALNV